MNEASNRVSVVVTLGKDPEDIKSELRNLYDLTFPNSSPNYLFVESVMNMGRHTLKEVYKDYTGRIAKGSIKEQD